jgi:glycosyltransferase involved in cell wall biosynthesis
VIAYQQTVPQPVICHLTDFGAQVPGSFVDALLCLALYCREKLQIEMLCLFPDRARGRTWLSRFDEDEVSYTFIPKTRDVVFDARYLLQHHKPIILHTHFSRPDISAVFLKMLLYKEAKIIWHLHSLAPLTFRQWVKDTLKVKLLARHFVDQCIAVGDGVYHNALDRGFPHEKLVLLHNGISTERFLPNNTRRESMRESFGLSNEHVVYLLLGRDPILKGVDLFVKAAAETVRHSSRNSFFLIIGGQETRDFVSRLPEASQLGTALRVIAPAEDFSSLLKGVDVLVSSSRSESFSYAISESMASGKLVISSDIPGIREIYGKSEGVWLFPAEAWQTLSSLMKRVQELPSSKREVLGQANAQYVVEHYALEKWVKKLGEIYRTLLKAENLYG